MSYSNAATALSLMQRAGMLGSAVQGLGSAVQGLGAGVTGISNWNSSSVTTQAYQPPFLDKDQHVFNCTKVENGWTFTYRSKTHIATTLDEMMEQMKAAMVVERIEK